MREKIFPAIIAAIFIVLITSVIPGNPFFNINWALFSALIIASAVLAFFWRFEKKKLTSKDITLISTMASLAAISRVPFAAVVNIQPTTFIVMITGYVFGSQTGFIVGAAAALVSNFFMGQGPWTPWQMFCWGICGVIGGLIPGKENGFKAGIFTVIAGLSGYLFGWIMNIWHWVGFVYPLTIKTFLAVYITSLPFDSLHALGNVVFSLIFGKTFYNVLVRFRKKLLVKDLGF